MAEDDYTLEKNLALVGDPGSGKTTYLGAIPIFCEMDPRQKYSFEGTDKASIEFLGGVRQAFIAKGFLGATSTRRRFEFVLRQKNPNSKLFEAVARFSFIDAPGDVYLNLLDEDDLGERLCNSHGIVLLINHSPNSDNLSLVEKMISTIRLRLNEYDEMLPQRLAICISQYDSPKIFDRLKENGYIMERPYSLKRSGVIPTIPEFEYNRKSFDGSTNEMEATTVKKKLTSRDVLDDNIVYNGSRIVSLLERNFRTDRIKYMAISSIGFLNQTRPDGKLFIDDNNYSNFIEENGKTHIVNFDNMIPVNLLMPIIWACSDNPI